MQAQVPDSRSACRCRKLDRGLDLRRRGPTARPPIIVLAPFGAPPILPRLSARRLATHHVGSNRQQGPVAATSLLTFRPSRKARPTRPNARQTTNVGKARRPRSVAGPAHVLKASVEQPPDESTTLGGARVSAAEPNRRRHLVSDMNMNPHASARPVTCDFANLVGVQLGVGGGTHPADTRTVRWSLDIE
jgi:hypothetical protein